MAPSQIQLLPDMLLSSNPRVDEAHLPQQILSKYISGLVAEGLAISDLTTCRFFPNESHNKPSVR